MITTLFLACGGWGHSQFRDAPSAALQCPEHVKVIFLDDIGYVQVPGFPPKIPPIVETIAQAKKDFPSIVRVVGAFHSMAWAAFEKAAGLLDFAIVLDAVGTFGVSHREWPAPGGVKQAGLLYRATIPTPGITGLWVANGPEILDRPCNHNQLPHLQDVIDATLQSL